MASNPDNLVKISGCHDHECSSSLSVTPVDVDSEVEITGHDDGDQPPQKHVPLSSSSSGLFCLFLSINNYIIMMHAIPLDFRDVVLILLKKKSIFLKCTRSLKIVF